MRHDAERPRTSGFLSDGTVPGHWTSVLGGMRANAFSHLSIDEVRAEATHLLILSPSPEVARACFGALLSAFGDSVEISTVGDLVAERIPAGTWVFMPHRQDGWTELEESSTRVRRDLVKENSLREAADRLVLMEYGVNLWMWAEPPSSGGDPVCHAGELISWESAWALGAVSEDSSTPTASARPPIYFGLPPLLRKRRWES